MRVALVGPPQSGKTTLFAAVAEAGGSEVDTHRPDQPHAAVVKVPDERLAWVSELFGSRKTTPAELEFFDVPGMDLSDEAGRHHARTHWPAMRQSDMLVFVVRAFEDDSVPAYRGRMDPAADVRELLEEMLFADLDQVTTRIEKLEAAIKKPTADRDAQLRELELMKRLAEALEAERPVSEAVQSEGEDKLIRSFAFCSQTPMLVALNASEDDLAGGGEDDRIESLPCVRLSAKIEEEIAQLPPEDRAEFLADLGLDEPARDRLIRACFRRMGLVSFFTPSEKETRAVTVPEGTDALTAAGEVHSDIARGFIRAEVVGFDDLKAAGDMKSARAAGTVRLEGKSYVVQDGDVVYFRFNV
jgi:GTP-binding protein YchF